MTTNQLSPSEADAFDYLIVGGGTAGCVIASRLAEYLPHKKILMIEAGPSDFMDDRVLLLKDWLSLLGGELDYDYGTTEQPNGRPFEYDCKVWESQGCQGWSFKTFTRVLDKLRNTIQPVHERHRNQLCKDWVDSCSTALDIPVIHDFNKEIRSTGCLKQGVGFFSVAYNPDDGRRSSASVAYIHPLLRGEEERPNLTILTNAWVSKINISGDVAEGVNITLQSGDKLTLKAKKETILCAGAIDTPRLMLLSGLGPREQLESLSVPVVKDLPGVGENLLDHPETIIIWELNAPVPPNCTTMDSDAGIFLRREPPNSHNGDGDIADLMMHCYQIPFCLNTSRLGYDTPIDAFCMTPNIPRPKSKGRLYLTSADPTVKPALDFRYFTDPEGYDAATIVAGFKAARKVAQQEPFKSWIKREVAPGPGLTSDEDLSEYGRKVAHTVYHPAGTTKMGDVQSDPKAVVDSKLKVRGIKGLRIADAGVFPEMTTINPMLTVLGVGERAAELIAEDAGWKLQEAARL
ncbi:MAG: hypothetical protein M1834_000075 [Cirrosporium novae-zelandiae]|nr:MAG: hypothetical protein M1834_000075 [Cirrosporium novae-zelandiae]